MDRQVQPVDISAIPQNSAPHIVTEGFVSEVRIDAEDGDTLFKLVENPTRSEPFVISEIIEPYRLKVPPIGSRVRVFGGADMTVKRITGGLRSIRFSRSRPYSSKSRFKMSRQICPLTFESF